MPIIPKCQVVNLSLITKTEEMFSVDVFILFFKVLIIFSAISVVSVRNPVYSVVFLIITFLNVSILLFFYKVEYFAVLLILVYLGAIAVLFLFVVMLLNIRIFEITQQTTLFVPFSIVCVLFYFILVVFFECFVDFYGTFLEIIVPNWVVLLFSVHPIVVLGSLIFTQGFIFLFIISLILLVAVIGSIYLTLVKSRKLKLQDDYLQVIRQSRLHLFLRK